MKKLLILLFSILFPLLSSAQKGSVMTPDKKPIAGVLVTLSKTDSTFVKSVATDTDGRFDLMSDVRPYLISFDHSAYAPKSMRAETDDLGDIILDERAYNLDEVVVSPKDMEQFATHKSYHLSEEQMGRYPDFLHALSEIPMLLVGIDNKLSYMGMGSVKILLNGVSSTESEIAALNPRDIAEIKVYDTPPARFAAMGLTCVIDVITQKNITGGSVGINLRDAFRPIFGENTVGVSYNKGESRWSFSYDNTIRRIKKDRLSQRLAYEFEGKEYIKEKEGIDSRSDRDENSFRLGYMNSRQKSYQFNITGYAEANRRNGNHYQNVRYSDGQTFLSQNTIDNSQKSYYLDLYYNREFDEHNEALINITGTYYDSRLLSAYSETEHNTGTEYFKSYSDITSRKPSLIAETQYSHSMKIGTLSLGVRDYLQYNLQNITTEGTTDKESYTLSNRIDVFGDLSGHLNKKLYYKASLGVEHSYFRVEDTKTFSSFYLHPRISLRYLFANNMQVFAFYRLNTVSPTVSMLSQTPVWIDNKYVYQGNPNLRPYLTHYFLLGAYYYLPRLTFAMNLIYYNSPNDILPYFVKGDNAIVQTYANMKKSERYEAVAEILWYPFKSKILSFTLTGMLYKYNVVGYDYNWTQNSARLFFRTNLDWKKFGVELFYQTTSKMISGQLLRRMPSAAYGELHYRPLKGMTAGIGWRYPFFYAYEEGTETHPSALVQNVTTTQIRDYANMVYIRFIYNFSFGRNVQPPQKKTDNKDTDSGILLE